MKRKLLMAADWGKPGDDYMLCQVEGCSRTSPDGQDEICGLAKIYGLGTYTPSEYCGAQLTIDLWVEQGKLGEWARD